MGRRRGSVATLACALGALVLVVAGCGAEERVNDPRPQPPTHVSVAITEGELTVQPERIAIGPEPTRQIPQNEDVEQPTVRGNAPLSVLIVAANLTDIRSRLVVRGPRDTTSVQVVANGNGSLLADLPTGTYRLTAAGLPDTEPARLVVGPYRTSSENDILLP
jgi:hypothetical protein